MSLFSHLEGVRREEVVLDASEQSADHASVVGLHCEDASSSLQDGLLGEEAGTAVVGGHTNILVQAEADAESNSQGAASQ